MRGNVSLIDFNDTREGKQKLFHREWVVQLTQNHCRQQVGTVVPSDEPIAIAIRSRNVARAWLAQALIDDGVDAIGNLGIDKRRELRGFIVSSARDDLRQPFR